MNIPSEYQQQKAFTEVGSLDNKSFENLDTNSLKDDLNKSIELGRKKRKQLTLENPEFQIKQEIEDEKQNIKVQNAIRKGMAEALKIQDLLKLKLSSKDNSNPLHSLFRWFLLIFYKENPDMYNWSEFKKQILEKHHGEDLQHRLAYQSVVHITHLEGEKTKFLLNLRNTILSENKKPEEGYAALMKIFDIIEIVYKTHEHARRVNQLVDEVIKQEGKIKEYNSQIEEVNHQIQEAKTSLKSLESKSLNEEDEIIQQ